MIFKWQDVPKIFRKWRICWIQEILETSVYSSILKLWLPLVFVADDLYGGNVSEDEQLDLIEQNYGAIHDVSILCFIISARFILFFLMNFVNVL